VSSSNGSGRVPQDHLRDFSIISEINDELELPSALLLIDEMNQNFEE